MEYLLIGLFVLVMSVIGILIPRLVEWSVAIEAQQALVATTLVKKAEAVKSATNYTSQIAKWELQTVGGIK